VVPAPLVWRLTRAGAYELLRLLAFPLFSCLMERRSHAEAELHDSR